MPRGVRSEPRGSEAGLSESERERGIQHSGNELHVHRNQRHPSKKTGSYNGPGGGRRGRNGKKSCGTNGNGQDYGSNASVGHYQGLQQQHHVGYTTLRYNMNHGLQFPHPTYGSIGNHGNPTSIVFTSQQFVPFYQGNFGVGGWTETGVPGHVPAGLHAHGHPHLLARTSSGPGTAAPHNIGDSSKDKQPMAPPSTLGNLWTSSALPAIEDNNADSPDLERFLRASTPRFRLTSDLNSLRDFKMMDVWRHFERISAYGLRCATYGGPRGPSSSYFVPFLSSIQLFVPVDDEGDGSRRDDADEILEYPEGLEAWPRHMRRLYSWGAKSHVGERLPLNQQVTELCGSEGAAHVLASSKVSQLHPYSWFAVAWYPLYRVPEAPLTARFLTFHSLAPLWEAAQQSIADRKSISSLHKTDANTSGISDTTMFVERERAGFVAGDHRTRPASHKSSNSSGNLSVGSFFPSSKTDRTERTEKGVLGTFPESTASDRSNSDGSSQKLAASASVSGHGSEAEKEEECLEKSPSCGATTISSTASLSKIELPPVGLCWHTGSASSRSRRLPSENWTDTMVKLSADMDQTGISSGDSLPGSTNACVVNVSSGYVVVKKDYPLSKGGPLSWDIQMEELAEGAKRLALGAGIVSVSGNKSGKSGSSENSRAQAAGKTTKTFGAEEQSGGTDPSASDMLNACPDYAFFLSRASSMASHNGR